MSASGKAAPLFTSSISACTSPAIGGSPPAIVISNICFALYPSRKRISHNLPRQLTSFVGRELELTQLAHNPLIVPEHNQTGRTRYHMLETIRQYAREKLIEANEETRAKDAHRMCFAEFTVECEKGLRGPKQTTWRARFDAERDNLRAALAWAIESNAESSLQLAGRLGQLWYQCAMLSDGISPPARAKSLYAAGLLAAAEGDPARAHSLLSESLKLFEELKAEDGITKCRAEIANL